MDGLDKKKRVKFQYALSTKFCAHAMFCPCRGLLQRIMMCGVIGCYGELEQINSTTTSSTRQASRHACADVTTYPQVTKVYG